MLRGNPHRSNPMDAPIGAGARMLVPTTYLSYAFRLYDTVIYWWKRKTAVGKERLSLQLEAGGRKAIQAAPEQPVDEHDDRGHDERRSQQHIEAARIAGAADGAAKTRRRNNPSLEMKIFRDDAGVPRSARCRHQARYEIRKYSRQDQVTPAIPGAEAVDLRRFLEVGRNGQRTGDDVEENVPLRAEEHQEHRSNLQAAAKAKQKRRI